MDIWAFQAHPKSTLALCRREYSLEKKMVKTSSRLTIHISDPAVLL